MSTPFEKSVVKSLKAYSVTVDTHTQQRVFFANCSARSFAALNERMGDWIKCRLATTNIMLVVCSERQRSLITLWQRLNTMYNEFIARFHRSRHDVCLTRWDAFFVHISSFIHEIVNKHFDNGLNKFSFMFGKGQAIWSTYTFFILLRVFSSVLNYIRWYVSQSWPYFRLEIDRFGFDFDKVKSIWTKICQFVETNVSIQWSF